jgi:hypothetical protein
VPDLKVAVGEHFLGLLNCILIKITNDRVRTRDLVANRQFVNSVIVGRSHVRKYDTARRGVECQAPMYSMVSWKMQANLETKTTSGSYRTIFSLSRRIPARCLERA